MNTIVPLISSGVAGPLGVLHLPRLWLNHLADDATIAKDAVNLNNLDDWKEFYEAVLK